MSLSYYNDLIAPQLDNVVPAGGDKIRRLMICTTPRTAGHSLCDAFRRIGWGKPTEYFSGNFVLPLQQRWLRADVADMVAAWPLAPEYGRKLDALRSVNGIFSAKIFSNDVPFVRAALGPDDDLWCYLYLERRDKVSQVISMAALGLTGQPFDGEMESFVMPVLTHVDGQALERLFNWTETMERWWRNELIDHPRKRFMTVTTEDFLAAPGRVLAAIRDRFGLPAFDPGLATHAAAAGPYKRDAEIKNDLRQRYGKFLSDLAANRLG